MVSGPITSWEIDGETVETVSDFIFGGSKITADGDCSHEIKRRLLLGRKVMTNLDSIFKNRAITLPKRVCLVKAMVFPRFLCAWDLPGQNTGASCHFLLQGIFPNQGPNLCLLHCRQILYQLSHQGSLYILSIFKSK